MGMRERLFVIIYCASLLLGCAIENALGAYAFIYIDKKIQWPMANVQSYKG
jgi:hypothetical protein